MGLAVVVLAAGAGTRMRSALPKVLHRVAGRPMVEHVVRTALGLGPEVLLVVVGVGADRVTSALEAYPVRFAYQAEQRGTGHALQVAGEALRGHQGPLLVLNGDGPALTAETLHAAVTLQGEGPGMTLLTVTVDEPAGLGRIVRGPDGRVTDIVEQKDAAPEQLALLEVNPGIYIFDPEVWTLVGLLRNENAQGEYYITDLPRHYLAAGMPVRSQHVVDPSEVLAANDRRELAHLERVLRDRIRSRWLVAGVTMLAPEQTWIDDTVQLARDVVLEPGVFLRGRTVIGEGASIGAYAVLEDCSVAPGALVAPHACHKGRELS